MIEHQESPIIGHFEMTTPNFRIFSNFDIQQSFPDFWSQPNNRTFKLRSFFRRSHDSKLEFKIIVFWKPFGVANQTVILIT